MAKSVSGASKGAKKINPFNDGKLEGVNISTHDNPIFKSVPATGVRGDQPASGDLIRLSIPKDEPLYKTQDRLRRV